MSSPRSRSSRADGAKSRGPKTPESRRRSIANNLRHGLLTRTVVLEDENLQAFTNLVSAFENDLNPQTETERALVENMAVGRRRRLRLWAIERATLKVAMDKHDPAANDPSTHAALAFRTLSNESRSLDLLNRYEARFDRQYARSLSPMLKMSDVRQASRPVEPVNSGESEFFHANPVPNSDSGREK